MKRVAALVDRFYEQSKGEDNDVRIAGNFALLAAAFEEMAEYLKDVWPEADDAKRVFVEEHIPELQEATLNDVHEQKASQVFLDTLAMLVKQGSVEIRGFQGVQRQVTAKPIGRVVPCESSTVPAAVQGVGRVGRVATSCRPEDRAVEIWTAAALAEVQQALRQQGRALIQASERALLKQLREDGVLLNGDNRPIPPEGDTRRDKDVTRQLKLDGQNRRAFRLREATLMAGWRDA